MDTMFGNGILMIVGALFVCVELARWGAPAVLEAVDRSYVAWKERSALREETRALALRARAERLRQEAQLLDELTWDEASQKLVAAPRKRKASPSAQ